MQAGKRSVVRIHHAVAVVVQLGERFKAVGCVAAVLEHGVVAKQLTPGGDLAVRIQVTHQQAIFLADPGGVFCEACGVEVEVNALGEAVAQPGRAHAVAIEVQHQGGAGLLGVAEATPRPGHAGEGIAFWRC